MQNSYCGSSGTAPLSVSVDPGIKKSLSLNVGFACLHTLRPKHSCGGGCVSEDVDGYRFRRDLLLLRVRLFDAGQKLTLALDGPIVVDQDQLIVEKFVECFAIRKFVSLVPCFFQGNDFRLGRTIRLILRRHR